MSGNQFSGKVALVTGSSRGIGRAIALELAHQGADIIVHYARKKSAAEAVAREIEALGKSYLLVKANLAFAENITGILGQIEKAFGRCDIFVGNAAIGVQGPVLDIKEKHWDRTMDINARSILRIAKGVVPMMEKFGWGRIVNITSLGSSRYVPSYGAVGISKASIEALTRYLSVELAPKGIVVNAISPGLVKTSSADSMPFDMEKSFRHVMENIPARRHVSPQDVAKVASFLCSEDARMIIGQTIIVDGGYSLLTDYFQK